MANIRVVCQDSPSLFRMLGICREEECAPVIDDGRMTYYLAERHHHYILYKAALSGWGAAAPNPMDPRPVFDPAQR